MPKKKPSYICECKTVYLSEIVRAIRKHNAETLLDIQNITKATTGCGRCKNQVEYILGKELEQKRKGGYQLRLKL
jgi:NAD(P)H-nitrite reductase large subunit